MNRYELKCPDCDANVLVLQTPEPLDAFVFKQKMAQAAPVLNHSEQILNVSGWELLSIEPDDSGTARCPECRSK
jgi:hypothetical protein